MTDQSLSMPVAAQKTPSARLGLNALIALVVGSMIGGGVFSLPQNMASGAASAAVLIGWLNTAVGILVLAFVYHGLSRRKPNLDYGPWSWSSPDLTDTLDLERGVSSCRE